MAFTIPNSGDRIAAPGVLDQILFELGVALNERRGCVGLTPIVFPAISGSRISATGASYLSSLKTDIAALVGTGDNVFLRSDGSSTYADIDAVLAAAGHSGGWVTDLRISNKAIWTQFHDVLGVLKNYRRVLPSVSYPTAYAWGPSSGHKSVSNGIGFYANPGDLWTDVLDEIADTATPELSRLGWAVLWGGLGNGDASIEGPAKVIHYNTSGCLGIAYKFTNRWYRVYSSNNAASPFGTVLVDYAFEGQTGNVLSFSEDPSPVLVDLAIVSPQAEHIPMDGAFDLAYHIQDAPASIGWYPASSFIASAYVYITGLTNPGEPANAASPRIWADATSDLTYG